MPIYRLLISKSTRNIYWQFQASLHKQFIAGISFPASNAVTVYVGPFTLSFYAWRRDGQLKPQKLRVMYGPA